jgi:glucose 1-dehydrogenase
MRLQGRRALVTGSDSGIGRAIARAFADEGAHVAVHYHRDKAGAEETAAAIKAHGRNTEVIQWDLSKPDTARGLLDAAIDALGGIDILVNCAGVTVQGTGDQSSETPLDEFKRVFNVNVISPWVLCQAAIEHFDLKGGPNGPGVIINVTSVHEEIPSKGGAAYDASKAALRNISRTLAMEVAKKGIRVNNIAPGLIDTPMTESETQDPGQVRKFSDYIPLGRAGRPTEVAHVAVFLASDDASYVTGSSYFVDGGLMQMVGAGA